MKRWMIQRVMHDDRKRYFFRFHSIVDNWKDATILEMKRSDYTTLDREIYSFEADEDFEYDHLYLECDSKGEIHDFFFTNNIPYMTRHVSFDIKNYQGDLDVHMMEGTDRYYSIVSRRD